MLPYFVEDLPDVFSVTHGHSQELRLPPVITSPYQVRPHDPIVVNIPPVLSHSITYDPNSQVINWSGKNLKITGQTVLITLYNDAGDFNSYGL